MTWTIHTGDVLDELRKMPAGSVQCCVTSPPYWSLRDYGVDGQIGLEETVEEWVAQLVAVFAEVRRVLRDDGTLWLNLGDSYSGSGGYAPDAPCNKARAEGKDWGKMNSFSAREGHARKKPRPGHVPPGLKPKDLIGLPWRVAFALQADGWILRSDIIWHKPNPMPESVTDRPTKAHEYVFLFAKRPRYFYDADAVREGTDPANHRPSAGIRATPPGSTPHGGPANGVRAYTSRNARTVWTINPQATPEAHFATFPEALAERCIKAGASSAGACCKCGSPWTRVVEKGEQNLEQARACGADSSGGYTGKAQKDYAGARAEDPSAVKARILEGMRERRTVGWKPSCDCGYAPQPCVVLDPFAGSGTTLLVAERLGRDSVGIELNPEYVEIAKRRIRNADPFEAQPVGPNHTQETLW